MNPHDKNNHILNNVAENIMSNNNASASYDLTRYYPTLAAAGAALAGGALYYVLNRMGKGHKREPALIDFKNQTREIPGTNGARISTMSETDEPLRFFYDDAKTLYELFRKAEKLSNDGPYLGAKPSPDEPYKWIHYSEANTIGMELGSAFIKFGMEPAKESFIGIYAKNRPEWVLTEVASNAFSFVNVPLYETLGVEAISFILVQTQLRIVVCDDSEKALQLMNSKSNLEYIIVIDKLNEEAKNKAAELDIKIMTFDDCRQVGRNNLQPKPIAPKPDDLATICYTSGTTGVPKGALITHANIVSIVSTLMVYFKKSPRIVIGEERYLSYLPLAHMLERVSQNVIVGLGGRIGFFQGDIRKLVDDMKEIKPTIFVTVPRLLNRIYSKITENIDKSSKLKKTLFKWAFANKEKEVMKGIVRNNSIYDFAFKQIRESLGGCTKYILTGSAPISPEVLHFMRVVSGCHVLEGYGATETGGASGIQIPGETSIGNVGPPFLCSQYKLLDVPEMNLVVSRDKRGEILIRGANIFKGYFKDDEKTKQALDNEGWYHSGDIGCFDENGCLKVVDRVKNIFKLQQGEYIAPEKIENIYVRSKYVAQTFVYGSSYKSNLIAIIVPEETVLKEWAAQNNVEGDLKSLCRNKQLKKIILDDMTKIGKDGGLKGFEQTKDIYLHHDLFSIENNLLTPTMKSKRNELKIYFQAQIDELYEKLD
jgi:long-chain acyl-CoA synthetase